MAWTKEQINFLVNNESTKTYAEIADCLGKTTNAVQLKALDLGIIKTRIVKPMTSKRCPKCLEVKEIESFYTYHSNDRNARRISNYCKPCSRKYNRKRIKDDLKQASCNLAKKQVIASKTIEEQCANFLGISIDELKQLPGIVESFKRNRSQVKTIAI